MSLTKFIDLCNGHKNSILKHFQHQKSSLIPLVVNTYSHLQPQANTDLFPVSTDLLTSLCVDILLSFLLSKYLRME